MKPSTLSPNQLHKIDAYWRTANYRTVGRIYLYVRHVMDYQLKILDWKWDDGLRALPSSGGKGTS